MTPRFTARDVFICLALAAATIGVYAQLRAHDFVNYDDPDYVTENEWVVAGLRPQSVIWAFTTRIAWNYHPLTWISHMLDVSVFGLRPGAHHLVNLTFHVLNTLLLFIVLGRMTAKPWRSAFVAAVFALHPLHVETVAWVAERKDVLSTFFGLAAVWAYIAWVARPSIHQHLLILVLYACSLLAKPMLVTLPFVLLLLDWWPLSRGSSALAEDKRQSVDLVMEKFWLFLLAAASCIATVWAQQGEAIKSMDSVPLLLRIENAAVSYLAYLVKMFVPTRLAVFYPFPTSIPLLKFLAAVALLGIITIIAWRTRREMPYLLVGWLWFLGMLVPVIGIVQVGEQARADRYTYLPLVGIAIAVTWWAAERLKYSFVPLAAAALIALAFASSRQCSYWRDSLTLFTHSRAVTGDTVVADMNLGYEYYVSGDFASALDYYERAQQFRPHTIPADFMADLRRRAAQQSHENRADAKLSP